MLRRLGIPNMKGRGLSCFCGAAMKRTELAGPLTMPTGIDLSALYPTDGLKLLMVDKRVRCGALNDRESREEVQVQPRGWARWP